MNADDILDELEAMLQNISPNQKIRLQNVLGVQGATSNKFADKQKKAASAAQSSMTPKATSSNEPKAPAEPKRGSPEYFAAKRAQGATAAQASMAANAEKQTKTAEPAAPSTDQTAPEKPGFLSDFGTVGAKRAANRAPSADEIEADRERLMGKFGESKFYSKFLNQDI